MVLKCWYLPHTRRALARCATKLASLSGYTVTMTNFATDQIDTPIFAVTTAKRSAPLATTATFGYYFLAKTAASNCWFACLSHLATFGYYLLAKTAASNNCWLAFHLLPYLVTTSWSKTAASINCWLFLYFSISAIIGYITASPAPSNKLALPLFFHLCHIWLHPNQSTTKWWFCLHSFISANRFNHNQSSPQNQLLANHKLTETWMVFVSFEDMMKPAVASTERIGLCHHHRQTTRQTVFASYIFHFVLAGQSIVPCISMLAVLVQCTARTIVKQNNNKNSKPYWCTLILQWSWKMVLNSPSPTQDDMSHKLISCSAPYCYFINWRQRHDDCYFINWWQRHGYCYFINGWQRHDDHYFINQRQKHDDCYFINWQQKHDDLYFMNWWQKRDDCYFINWWQKQDALQTMSSNILKRKVGTSEVGMNLLTCCSSYHSWFALYTLTNSRHTKLTHAHTRNSTEGNRKCHDWPASKCV